MDKYEVKCNVQLRPNYFCVNIFVLAFAFCGQLSKNQQFPAKLSGFFVFVGEMQQLVQKRSQKKKLGRKCTLHFTFYLSIALSKILPHSKTVKNTKKNDPGCLSNFLQTRIF